MIWPYSLDLQLTVEQKHQRREVLDLYGVYAQISALVPVLVFLIYRLGAWLYSWKQRFHVQYKEVPTSSAPEQSRESLLGAVARRMRGALWWLQTEFYPDKGPRAHWIAGFGWLAWLLFLCVHRTGRDYYHLTKRFGEIGASQLPLHYMLSMKSICSPLSFIVRSSHEELNPWHRVLGRVIYFLFVCHTAFYLNAFIQKGALLEKLSHQTPFLGLVTIILLTILILTSFPGVRRWSYRVFFTFHLVVGTILPPLLFFHVTHLRVYVIEALILFLVDLIARKLYTVKGFAKISLIPHTKLLKLSIVLPESRIKRCKAAAGQHVYLSVPAESTPPGTSFLSIHKLLFNPFTIASVSPTELTLVLRVLNGPTTKALNSLTKLWKAKPPINIEGPYGNSRHFPNLVASYDRFLLVAGGVGATYTLPIYRELKDQLEAEGRNADCVKLVWSMRSAADASWAFDSSNSDPSSSSSPSSSTSEQKRFEHDDDNIQIYVTGIDAEGIEDEEEAALADGSVELADLRLPLGSRGGVAPVVDEHVRINGGRTRPDLGKIVRETFGKGSGERVAVLVCGPKRMVDELRGHVGKWVWSGRDVWWHDEGFGW